MNFEASTRHVRALLTRFGRFSLGVLTFLVAMATAVYLYLHSGPVDLARITPQVNAALAHAVPGVQFRIGQLTAERDAFRREIIIRARAVQLDAAQFALAGTIPQLTIVVPQGELARPQPRPSRIQIDGLTASVALTPVQLRRWLDGGSAAKVARLPWPEGLRQLQVSGAVLDVRDLDSGTQQRLSLERLTAQRGLLTGAAVVISGRATLRASNSASNSASGPPADLRLTVTARAEPEGPWDAALDVTAQHLPQLLAPWVSALRLPSGLPSALPELKARVMLVAGRDHVRSNGTLTWLPGTLVWAPHYPTGLPTSGGRLAFDWSPRTQQLNLSNIMATAHGATVTARATLFLEAIWRSTAEAQFSTLSVGQLQALWPERAAPGGRDWVRANLTAGTLRNGRFQLRRAAAPGAEPPLALTFAFDGLAAEYRRPMPPLLAGAGTAALDNQGMTLQVAQGSIGGLPVASSRVRLGPFPDAQQYADLDVALAGPLPRLLAVLDSPPLRYISRFGQDPAAITGTVAGRLSLRIPLTRDVTFDDIVLMADATTTAARVPAVYGRHALENAALKLRITNAGLTARGTALLAGQKLALAWAEDFTGTSPTPTRYDISTASSVAGIAAIGIDLTTFGSGPVQVQLALTGRAGSIARGTFAADLTQSVLQVPPFGEVKPAGIPARITGALAQVGRQLNVDPIVLSSASVSAELTARIPLDAGRADYAISSFRYGANQLRGLVSYGTGQPLTVRIDDATIDLRDSLLAFRNGTRAAPPVDMQTPVMPLKTDVTGKLARVLLLNDVTLANVDVSARLTDQTIIQLAATARLSASGPAAPIQLSLDSVGTSRRLELRTDDAGLLARGLDIFRDGRGGTLTATAQTEGSGPRLAIAGVARMSDFRVMNAPALARTLTIASLTGLADTLGGRGIAFRRAELPFTLRQGIVEVRGASAVGPGLGLTLSGQAARRTGQINMRGTIVPSYGLNGAIGKIPLVGRLIVGGKDQGLIGFTYRITGTVQAPQVAVTKASGLAPGFLRRVFDGRAATVDAPEPEPYTPAAAPN